MLLYKITVFEAVDGSLGGSADKIIVQFVKRDYLLDDGVKIYVLSLSKIGDWK
jgi:predicted NAD/FAD-binding protein